MFLHRHPALESRLGMDGHVIVDEADWQKAVAPLTLSRRNLLTLLHKLTVESSHRMLVKPGGRMIAAEPDATHYQGREAGPVHPETEAFIRTIDRHVTEAANHIKGELSPWAVKAAERIVNWLAASRAGSHDRYDQDRLVTRFAFFITEEAYRSDPQPNLQRLSVDEYRRLRKERPELFGLR